jgi:hypothetical protein
MYRAGETPALPVRKSAEATEIKMKRKPLILILSLLLSISVVSRSSQSTQQTSLPKPTTIPFEMANRHIMLKVKVNNSRPLSFVLDTGDKYAIVDLGVAKELGLGLREGVRMGGAGADTVMGAFVDNASFSIPGLEGFSQLVKLALPTSRMAPRLGQDFDGIIGCDFIKEFVVEIDYETNHIKLHDKDKFIYSGPGESIPIQVNQAGHPILEAEVTPLGSPATKGKFILDIGSGGALALHSPFVANGQLLAHQPRTIKAIGGGAGGEIKGQIGRVTELKIGTFRIKNPITMFSEDKAGAFANTELLGNIGTQITSKFRLFLDYGRKRIIFEPNASFGKPFDRAFDGLSLAAEGKDYRTFRVREVIPDTPAAEAGLQVNDIITSIDNRPVTEFNLTQIREMFEREKSYQLTVRRGEQTLQLKLTPRKIV